MAPECIEAVVGIVAAAVVAAEKRLGHQGLLRLDHQVVGLVEYDWRDVVAAAVGCMADAVEVHRCCLGTQVVVVAAHWSLQRYWVNRLAVADVVVAGDWAVVHRKVAVVDYSVVVAVVVAVVVGVELVALVAAEPCAD